MINGWRRHETGSVMVKSPELSTKNCGEGNGTMTSYTKLQLQLPNCKHKDLNLYDRRAKTLTEKNSD